MSFMSENVYPYKAVLLEEKSFLHPDNLIQLTCIDHKKSLQTFLKIASRESPDSGDWAIR